MRIIVELTSGKDCPDFKSRHSYQEFHNFKRKLEDRMVALLGLRKEDEIIMVIDGISYPSERSKKEVCHASKLD